MIINCNSTPIDLLQGHVMGVLNVTPDSFYDGGKYKAETKILSQVKQMLEERRRNYINRQIERRRRVSS